MWTYEMDFFVGTVIAAVILVIVVAYRYAQKQKDQVPLRPIRTCENCGDPSGDYNFCSDECEEQFYDNYY